MDISDGIFLRKYLTASSPQLFLQISFIIHIRLGSKYAYDYGQAQKQSTKDILKIF